ncbi:unnamed protein product [Haemonchus placei]|uniref:Core-binding (CB) domain-containing protein n=1 Tax=Haemonchus placei TaxID=6290 RepID=A0A0N4VWV4_HAEPC|nr:unnamed protein product [Haemonchus placei]
MGLMRISVIIDAINSDRAPSTIRTYTSKMEKFRKWRNGPYMRNIPTPQARNLYLAKCSAEARYKSMPTVIAALSYFCGPLQGVDKEIQDSLLEAVKRSLPPPQHRNKIRPEQMRKIIKVGSTDSGPKVI